MPITLDGSLPGTLGVSVLGNIVTDGNINFTSSSAILSTTGNIIAGNILPTGQVSATGNITGGNITGGNVSATGNIIGNTAGFTVGYLNIPQVSAANVTFALTDAGKHYYSTASSTTTLTIPTNASVAFATGTAIGFVNQGTGNITIAAAAGVTLYLGGNSTAGNRTVTTYGIGSILKVATDTWFITGANVV
jgi:hypothetical protein